jgi:phosphotransferase system IIB component
MKLQRTYKPKDYNKIAKDFSGETTFPISCSTLSLICNHFEKLGKRDREKVKSKLFAIEILHQNIKRYQNIINTDEKERFKNEIEIIKIFQRNNI